MARPSYADAWKAHVREQGDGYRQILEMDAFRTWERNSRPDGLAGDRLEYGLRLIYGGGSQEDARAYFELSRAVMNRALDENKLESPTCLSGFPKNRGQLVRAGTYAGALLGEPCSREALLAASTDLEAWCKNYEPRQWKAQAQAHLLAAVRLALIAQDPARALDLIKSRRSFKWHEEESSSLREIARVAAGERAALAAEAIQQFDAYFDRVRDPDHKSDVYIEHGILRFELAVIREMYLEERAGALNWERAAKAVAH